MAWDRYFCHIHPFWLTDIRTPLLKHLYPLAFSNMNKYSSGHLAIAETGKTPSHISGFARSSLRKQLTNQNCKSGAEKFQLRFQYYILPGLQSHGKQLYSKMYRAEY